jgi:XTP/dITP diphosphohydrolase
MIYLVTSNQHKFEEIHKRIQPIQIKWIDLEYPEIQSQDLNKIAKESVRYVYNQLKKPVFLEDSGLFISALNGFPGPYSSFVYKTIGLQGILNLMKNIKERTAKFISVVAYHDGNTPQTFQGTILGKISERPQGNAGFGYDPIFIPEAHTKTFAQIPEIKAKLSHRIKAIDKFKAWLVEKHGKDAFTEKR